MLLSGLEGKVTVDDLPWIPLGKGLEGNAVKILRVSEETGMYSMLIKAKAGTINQAHTHSGAADFYILDMRLHTLTLININSSTRNRIQDAVIIRIWTYQPCGRFSRIILTNIC